MASDVQLLALPVDDAHVDGELITDNRAAPVAVAELDAFDLRRQLSTLVGPRLRAESRQRLRLGSCVLPVRQ